MVDDDACAARSGSGDARGFDAQAVRPVGEHTRVEYELLAR